MYGCRAAQGAELLRRRFADSDARVGYRISVCSSGASSILQRASTIVGHMWTARIPHRGPAPGDAQQGCQSDGVVFLCCESTWSEFDGITAQSHQAPG